MEFGCTPRIMVFPEIHIRHTYNILYIYIYMFTYFDGAVIPLMVQLYPYMYTLTCIHYGIQVNGD